MYFNRGYRKRIIGKALPQPSDFCSAPGKVCKGALAVPKNTKCLTAPTGLPPFKFLRKENKSLCSPAAGQTEGSEDRHRWLEVQTQGAAQPNSKNSTAEPIEMLRPTPSEPLRKGDFGIGPLGPF